MKGIIGRKLGMTQVFDPETGRVTPVTVIEAGPCPIVKVKTVDSDGYEAVQLAFEPVPERKLTKPENGHLSKAGVSPHRHLAEIRGAHELVPGETVTVDVTLDAGEVTQPGRYDAVLVVSDDTPYDVTPEIGRAHV